MRRPPTRLLSAVALAIGAAGLAGCSGGGGSSSAAAGITPAARQQAAVEAARVCRMWTELISQALPVSPLTPAKAAPYDAKSAAIAPVANAASAADPTWNALATDIAGANDFASAALPDINTRIGIDCRQVPADAANKVAAEPDPFSTTTSVP